MLRPLALVLALLLVADRWCEAASPPPETSGVVSIEWRVENPFRLFKDPSLTDVHREVYESLTDAERLEPVLSAEHRLMDLYPHGWAEAAFRQTCWQVDSASYGSCGDDPYVSPTSHGVLVGLDQGNAPEGACDWTMVPLDAPGGTPEGHVHASCAATVQLKVPYPAGAHVSVAQEGAPVAETTIKVDDVFIVAMGDSYGSGEGNPDQPVEFSRDRSLDYGSAPGGDPLVGYPARVGDWQDLGDAGFLDSGPRWLSQACHRSLYAYSTRVALQLALEDPHRAVTYANFACAGAEVLWGLMLAYKGTEWAPDQPDRPQISAVARAQCGATEPRETNYQFTYSLNGLIPELENIVLATCPRGKARPIDLLLVSIGGNDVGFSRLVANTVLASKSTLRMLGGWMGEVEDASDLVAQIPSLELRYKALNRALHMHLQIPWDQSDRIVLTAYPVLAVQENGRDVCPEGATGMTVFPEFNLSNDKAQEGEKAGEVLNRAMRNVARAFSWTFVESHRAEFAGHGICAQRQEDSENAADELRIPRLIEGAWTPFNPADFRPYSPRRRWYRTPNDAFLTGNYHISSSILKQVLKLQSIEWFQLVLASTYSGAFHPTSEGQAVIADAVLDKARNILRKYELRRKLAAASEASRDR